MRILTGDTGKGQLEVLSVLASQKNLRQKDIVERSSLSKGAVSNNVEKLKEKELIMEEDGKLRVNSEKILSYYREHLEEFLIRSKNGSEELNEIRTLTKREVTDILETHEEEIWDIMKEVISESHGRGDLESMNSVYKETDRAIREYVTSKENSDLRLIAISTDKSYSIIEDLEETDNLKEAKKMLKEANKQ
jgi:DNA-binding MarR family transcriptional regulator